VAPGRHVHVIADERPVPQVDEPLNADEGFDDGLMSPVLSPPFSDPGCGT
jgi:hypothetical protein